MFENSTNVSNKAQLSRIVQVYVLSRCRLCRPGLFTKQTWLKMGIFYQHWTLLVFLHSTKENISPLYLMCYLVSNYSTNCILLVQVKWGHSIFNFTCSYSTNWLIVDSPLAVPTIKRTIFKMLPTTTFKTHCSSRTLCANLINDSIFILLLLI